MNKNSTMIGFHIDMNIAQFRGDYLKKWLKKLASLGYDTILWELENNVEWNTCPECVAPEAFSKKEFKEILDLCKSLGLESIPLLQILAHSTYALKNDEYSHLREVPDSKGMYCPLNKEVKVFLAKWIDEHLELFEGMRHFHLGSDEAGGLGRCDDCKDFLETKSKSELFVQHTNEVSQTLIEKGVTPVIWADMLLRHPEALNKLSKDIMLFDWRYEIYNGIGFIPVEIFNLHKNDEIPEDVIDTYGKYIFPYGQEPGRDADPFYTIDYLSDNGFKVVTCPSSCSYRDSVFAPLTAMKMRNTFDSMKKGLSQGNHGSLVTSWTVRLTPWELQLPTLNIVEFQKKYPGQSLEKYQDFFMQKTFGVIDSHFWRACAQLSHLCLFMDCRDLGFYKGGFAVHEDRAKMTLDKVAEGNRLDEELQNTENYGRDYLEAQEFFESFSAQVKEGQDFLKVWVWAAKNMAHRAKSVNLLLRCRKDEISQLETKDSRRQEATDLLQSMQPLREESKQLYLTMQKPQRTDDIMGWLYNSVTWGLEALIAD